MKTKLNIRRGQYNWKWNGGAFSGERINLANGIRPESWIRNPSQFRFQFGAYGETKVRVWAPADHYEDAFETAVEWLDEHAPGHLVNISRADLMACAADNGLPYPETDEQWEHLRELAEADLTVIGHTTLKHGGYVHSAECFCDEVTR